MGERPFLVLRLEAPLMSFGGVMVDQRGVTDPQPGVSMITGLLANALGVDRREADRLERLQSRLRLGVRCDRRGTEVVDYQTVDLSQDFMRRTWTTRGEPASRAGGSAATGTHIRYRHYWADAVLTAVLEVVPPDEAPTLDDLARALEQPERPLFLGRKPCLPSRPILEGRVEAATLYEALKRTTLDARADTETDSFTAWWPEEGEPEPRSGGRQIAVSDRRDWPNQIHTGHRPIWHGQIPRSEVTHEPG